jgi:hypothetical protein
LVASTTPGSWFVFASDLPQNLLERRRLHLYATVEGVVQDASLFKNPAKQLICLKDVSRLFVIVRVG